MQDTVIVIRRPSILVILMQAVVFVAAVFVGIGLFPVFTWLFRSQGEILSWLYALVASALMFYLVRKIGRAIEIIWNQSLIRSELEEEPFGYSDIKLSFSDTHMSFTAKNGDDETMEGTIDDDHIVDKREKKPKGFMTTQVYYLHYHEPQADAH